jgi:DNA polymerase III epsilon subunit family exonuclease
MQHKLTDITFTIFDTETTGLSPQEGDRIVEIAAARTKNGRTIDTFGTLVNPHRAISEAAFRVNQITPEMLQNAPVMNEVMPRFLDFIKDSCLCSYNAGFDLEFLNYELRLLGQGPLEQIAVIDVLKMARRLIPGLARYNLSFVTEALGIQIPQKHRALDDVELTRTLFNKCLAMVDQRGSLDFANFAALFALGARFLDETVNRKITEIQEAIDRGINIKIKYLATSNAEVTEREITPREIRYERGHQYLIGHCYLRNGERAFRIDSILHMEIV